MANELSLLMNKQLMEDDELKKTMALGQQGIPAGARGAKLPFQKLETERKEESAKIPSEVAKKVGRAPQTAVTEIDKMVDDARKVLLQSQEKAEKAYETGKSDFATETQKIFDDYSSKTAKDMSNKELLARILVGIAPSIVGAAASSGMGIGYAAGGLAGAQAGLTGLKAIDDATQKLQDEKQKIEEARAKSRSEAEKTKLKSLSDAVETVGKEIAELPGMALKGKVEVATAFPAFAKSLAEAATPKVIIQQGGEGGYRYAFPPMPRAGEDVGPTGKKLTKGQEALDVMIGKEYADYIAGGGATSVQKQVQQVRESLSELQKSDTISGPVVAKLPGFVKQKSVEVQENILNSVQDLARKVFGAQFTEKEGAKLEARTFNPELEEAVNFERARKVLQQLEDAAEIKDQAMKYFERFGTLQGFEGTATLGKIMTDITSGGKSKREILETMSSEQKKKYIQATPSQRSKMLKELSGE